MPASRNKGSVAVTAIKSICIPFECPFFPSLNNLIFIHCESACLDLLNQQNNHSIKVKSLGRLAGNRQDLRLIETVTSYGQIKSSTEQLINTHWHTHNPILHKCTYSTRPLLTTQWECVFLDHLKPKYLSCMSSLMKFCQEGVQELLRPSDNNSKFPEFSRAKKHPLLFQIVMLHRKQKRSDK